MVVVDLTMSGGDESSVGCMWWLWKTVMGTHGGSRWEIAMLLNVTKYLGS